MSDNIETDMISAEKPIIYTNNKCQGCNRCISACPVLTANYSIEANGKQHIKVHGENCIKCGACLDACEHNARSFTDDTEQFFKDLKNGKPISLLIAPSFQANYPDEYKQILGTLKKIGVRNIINVGFGADITTWAYINYIHKYNFKGGISQPCPVIVNYVEHYAPELIEKLMPIHSPLLCAAIYLKKYLNITDKLAFLNPCISKKTEITDPNTYGYVSYNVTFNHFMLYMKRYNITENDSDDNIEYNTGVLYPMPGGLHENIRHFLGNDVFVRQVEGEKTAYKFLNDYSKRISENKELPLLVDILNCERGCLYGTGIDEKLVHSDDNFYNLQKINKNHTHDNIMPPQKRLDLLNQRFADLKLEDFIREYTDKSLTTSVRKPNENELDEIFTEMKKDSWEKRNINCGACGYDNCKAMATAIFNGSNAPENCIYYMKDELHTKSENITLKNEELRRAIQEEKTSEIFISQMIHAFSKSIDLKDQYTKGHSTRVGYYAKKIAEKLGEKEKTVNEIYHIALLHDIGKLVVPKAILNKPTRLTDEEFDIIKTHTTNGYEILKEISVLPNLAIGARYHHERIDGKGYPKGMNADEIPYIAKIIAVADAFDAMNSTRSYRKRMSMDEIINELHRGAGTQFDPNIVDALIELIHEGVIGESDNEETL